MPAALARASACACGLSEPTATTSMPSRPCTRSRMACRLVPVPEARTPTLTPSPDPDTCPSRHLELRELPPGGHERAGAEQCVHPREDHLGAEVRPRAVRLQPVVGVLDDDLRAPAAQDLDRPGAADRRLGRAHDVEDRLVERPEVA